MINEQEGTEMINEQERAVTRGPGDCEPGHVGTTSTEEDLLIMRFSNLLSANKQQQKLPDHFLLTKVVARIAQVASAKRCIESSIVNGLIDSY